MVDRSLSIAAVNGPERIVLSGPAPMVNQVAARCEQSGVRVNRLVVSHAFHSALMEPALPKFAAALAGLAFSEPTIPVMTNLTGHPSRSGELGSAEYWLRQLPAECPKILVAARVDRGHPVLSNDELAAFCKRQGIAGGWIATSARENLGLDELLARMKQAIPWDDKPVVSTDAVFKRIKDFVLALKESRTRKQVIFTVTELHVAISKQLKRRVWKSWKYDAELISRYVCSSGTQSSMSYFFT